MKIVVLDDFAFRVRQDGVLEAAKIWVPANGGIRIPADAWSLIAPEEVRMTGGELDTVRQTVKRLADLFPSRGPLPSTEPSISQAPAPDAIR